MRVTEDVVGGTPLFIVTGELDQESKRTLVDALDRVLRGPQSPHHVLLDLSECDFVDSGGISALLMILDRISTTGWLGIIGVMSGPLKVLTYTGFLDLDRVRFFTNSDEAAVELAAEKDLARAQERVARAEAARSTAEAARASTEADESGI